MTELDGLFKLHEATDAAIVASASIPKRNVALARDTNQLIIRKEDNSLLRVMTGDRLERANPTATGTVTADAFRVSPTAGITSSAIGTFFWDYADHTVSLVLENGSELQLGREAVQWCKNPTGTPIQNGALVYVAGATGDNPTISLASATLGGAGHAIGMATQTITGNGEGMVATNISFVRGLDTSLYAPGTQLWLSTVAGQWSSTPPARPNYRVQVGFVLRQHANQGIVLLWIVRYPSLSEVSDVDTTGAATGQGLVYGADGVWRPGALLALGETSVAAYRGDRGKTAYDHSLITAANPHGTTAAQVGAAAAVHTHAAADTITGVFDEAHIPALPTSRVTGLDTALSGKSDVGHTHAYLPVNNPEFTGTLYGAGALTWRSVGVHYFSIFAGTGGWGVRDLNDDGSLLATPVVVEPGTTGRIRLGVSGGLRPTELGGNLTIGVAGAENVDIDTAINVKSGYTSSLRHQVAGAARWTEQLYQGTTFRWAAHDDTGAVIDYPLTMTRTAGGEMLWGGAARPTRFMGTVRSVGAVTVDTLAGTGNRPLVGSSGGVLQAQDAATFRGTIGAAAATDLSGYLPVSNPTFTGNITGAGSVVWKSGTVSYFSMYAGAVDWGLRDLADDGSLVNYPLVVKRGAAGEIQLGYTGGARPVRIGGALRVDSTLSQGATERITASGEGRFAGLRVSGLTSGALLKTADTNGQLASAVGNTDYLAVNNPTFTGWLDGPSAVIGTTSQSGQLNLRANTTGAGTVNVDFKGGTLGNRRITLRWSDTYDNLNIMTSNDDGTARLDRVLIPRSSSLPITVAGGFTITTGALKASSLADTTTRPAAITADGTVTAQDAATFRTTIAAASTSHTHTATDVGAFPAWFAVGGIDANNLADPGAYSLRVQTGSNWWSGLTGTQNVAVLQAHGADGLKSQIACDQRYGALYTRSQMSEFGNAWSGWATIWDSYSLPVGVTGKNVVAAATGAAARTAITAAKAVVMSTKSGSWTLDTNTELGIRQTASGTLTLPAASATYAGLTYKITATTTLTLTLSGSFVVIDSPNTTSYWYTEATTNTFLMQGGHNTGSRKTIELYCDGVEWFVKCV